MAYSATLTAGDPQASRAIIIFHGYTGSPDEFRELAHTLAERLNAYIFVPLLPGHGTDEHDLLQITLDDLLSFSRDIIHDLRNEGKELALIGHSFGGYLALLCADEARSKAIVLSVMPYVLRIRFWLPWIPRLMRLRKFWSKKLDAAELAARTGLFFYPRMPGVAMTLVNDGRARIKKIIPSVTCPLLTIYNDHDTITTPESGERIRSEHRENKNDANIVLHYPSHGVYYGPHRQKAIASIADFLEKTMLR